MKWLLIIGCAYIWFMFPLVRFVALHPITILGNGVLDLFKYIRYREWNRCHEYGKIRLNSAKASQVFGCGKTLSLVKQATEVYKRYNNQKVYDYEKKQWVTQHVHIISNVKLYDVPYIPWVGQTQFTEIDKLGFEEQDVTLYILDEVGTIFNSRNFKDNISMEFLTRLLQSRKNKMCLYMTAQRFTFTDKILRQSCSTVTTCKKTWRFIELCEYEAYEVENVNNVNMLRPISRKYWFAKDKDYHAYDTSQLIENLKKDNAEHNLLSTPEILETYGQSDGDIMQSTHLKPKFQKKIFNK